MLPSRWNNSGQIASATSTVSSSSPKSDNNSIHKLSQKISSPFRKVPSSPFRKRGIPGTQPHSINGAQSNSPSFLSNGTQISNPTYQYYVSKNQSAIPVSIILRNQHVSYTGRKRQWQNRPASLLKTTLEIYNEEEISRTSLNQCPEPIERQDSDVSPLSAASDSDEESSDNVSSPNLSSPGKHRCILYTKEHEASLHASWNNLTDLIHSMHSDLVTDSGRYAWFHDTRYKSLKARVYISKDELKQFYASHSEHRQHPTDEEISLNSVSFEELGNENTLKDPIIRQCEIDYSEAGINVSDDSTVTLAIIPMHPTLLRRLPPPMNNNISNPSTTNIPSALPTNTPLIKYSDGSVRVLPPLYKLLLVNGIINEKSFDVEGTDGKDHLEADRIEENKRTIRFSDNAFKALKQSERKNGNDNKKNQKKTGFELYPEDSVFSLLGETNLDESNHTAQDPRPHDTQPDIGTNNVFDDVWKDLKPSVDQVESNQTIEISVDNIEDLGSKNEVISPIREERDAKDCYQPMPNDLHNQELVQNENMKLRLQIQDLEKIIVLEESALRRDHDNLILEAKKSKLLVEELQNIEKRSSSMNSELEKLK